MTGVHSAASGSIPTEQTDRPAAQQDRFYIDCEFDGHDGELLSMALVRDAGGSIYLCVPNAPEPLEAWVGANVWPLVHMPLPVGRTVAFLNDWGPLIKAFIADAQHPTIVADSPVDIGRFCRVLSTGFDGQWASADFPLISFEVHNVDCYPTGLEGAVQHNAWWDAMALMSKLGGDVTAHRAGTEACKAVVNQKADR